jgi:hypothetical protein
VLKNGTLVLADGEYLRRADLLSLRVAAPEFVSDIAPGAEDEEDVSDGRGSSLPRTPTSIVAPAGGLGDSPAAAAPDASAAQPESSESRPASAGAPPSAGPVCKPAVCKTCNACHEPFTRTSNVQQRCPACQRQVERAKAVARLAARRAARPTQRPSQAALAVAIPHRIQAVRDWWALRTAGMDATAAAARLNTPERRQACLAKSLSADMLHYYGKQHHVNNVRGRLPVRARPPEGGTPGAPSAIPESGVPASAGPASLCARLQFVARRVGAAESLLARAERALEILEAAP